MFRSMTSAYRPMPTQRVIASEGYPFIATVLLGALIAALADAHVASLILCGLAIAVVLFFRNPERNIPAGDGIVVAPADGLILSIKEIDKAPITGNPSQRISIFLSVFNVHINRVPIVGSVKKIDYHPGRFLVASLDKCSNQNERNVIHLQDEKGRDVIVSQIAGLVARRIVCYLTEGLQIGRGDRLGLIRFGSRIDLYLPLDCEVQVKRGERVRGGSTIIGRMR